MTIVKQDGLIYLINEEDKNAQIIGYYEDRKNYKISRSIKHESQEYIVVSISENAFKRSRNIKSILFASDSELQTIERSAFISSTIESIFIPASLIDLKEEWCLNTQRLTKIEVDPRNSRYLNYDGKMIICKTSETSENYDKIVFVRRDIKEATIPSFIKIIGSSSFDFCSQLKRIDIPSNSELQIIEKHAFSSSLIESIFIPPHVTKICEYAFSFCARLKRIDIPSNSELETIEKGAFQNSSIDSIFIPASVIDLKNGWCIGINELITIKIDPRNPRYSYFDDKMIICKTSEKNENYDKIVFARRNIEEATIPSFIKIIGSYAFNCCFKFQKIDIPSNSELQTIEEAAFTSSSIKSIFIPPHVTKICGFAFSFCTQFQRIDIPPNSELQTIEERAFAFSSIQNIFIPADLIDLKKGWCDVIGKLTTIEVDPRNPRYSYFDDKMIICKTSETSENYDKIVFARRDIKEATIPSFIKIIGSSAFYHCSKLQKFDIPSNSELQTIEEFSFSSSSIESIFIPPRVTKICENAFNDCSQLHRIDIPSNSELETIEKGAFSFSSIGSIFIPAHITKINKNVFAFCEKLHLIEIDEKSKIELNDISSSFPRHSIIMIPVI